MSISPAALREIHKLQNEASTILSQRNVSRADTKRADLLIAKIANIRQAGISTDEQRDMLAQSLIKEVGESPEVRAHEELFRAYLSGASDSEIQHRATSFVVGSVTQLFTPGDRGGFLCPPSFAAKVAEARAAVDKLLDPDTVTLVQEDGFKLPPLQIPGFDLSTIEATIVGEADQQNPQIIPNADQDLLNRFMFRLNLAGTIEFAEDAKAYGGAENALARAIGVGMARGIGKKLVNGDGSTAPAGILTGAVNSGFTTAGAGTLTTTDFTDLFFSVNLEYRESPKAAWLVNDSTYKMIRLAKDSANRPLIDLDADVPTILGKPVKVTPSLSGKILFGDLSNFYVHSSGLFLRRRINTPGMIEFGKVLWTALQMVDSVVADPSEGDNAPIKFSTLHA